jgi:putative polymerase
MMADYPQEEEGFFMQPAMVQRVSATSPSGSSLVLLALIFNMALCLVSTIGHLHFSNLIVIICELFIISLGLFAIRRRITSQALRVLVLTGVLLAGLKLINSSLDLKILHDLFIMYVFYELGTLASIQEANRLLWIATAIVLPIGLFELLFPDQFNSLFDIWSYYVDKGVISQDTVNYSDTTLFVSGNRGADARSLFPFIFGPHRVSSVFLEPVSLGNFSVILFAWCLSVPAVKFSHKILLVIVAAFFFVLPDSRFASACWLLMLGFRFSPLYRSRFIIFCLPVLTMTALALVGSLRELYGVVPSITSDDFGGRLLFSGRLLDFWSLPQWLALAPSKVYTADTGYGYVVNNLGLPLALLFLGIFAFYKTRTAEAASMKAMIAIYMATSLCIGANMFSIKTASLCWFLYGAANAGWAFRGVGLGAPHLSDKEMNITPIVNYMKSTRRVVHPIHQGADQR